MLGCFAFKASQKLLKVLASKPCLSVMEFVHVKIRISEHHDSLEFIKTRSTTKKEDWKNISQVSFLFLIFSPHFAPMSVIWMTSS